MLTILIKTLADDACYVNGEPVFHEEIVEVERVAFQPAKTPDDEPKLALNGSDNFQPIPRFATIYVMNDKGKTVARYRGTDAELAAQAGQLTPTDPK